MRPDRLRLFQWAEFLLLPRQMWRELNANIWPVNHTHMQWHTYWHIHSWVHATRGFKGTGKRPSCCADPPPCTPDPQLLLWEQDIWFPGLAGCSPPVNVFSSHVNHTPLVFLWSGTKETDVENRKEEKVGVRNWIEADGGSWKRGHNGRWYNS